MFKKFVLVVTTAITLGSLASTGIAQTVKRYPYDVRPPVSEPGIDGFINRAADIGSTFLDKTLNGPPIYLAPYDQRPSPRPNGYSSR